MDVVEESEKAASTFIASIASAYGLSTRKLTLSDLNNALSGLHNSLQLKWRLRKLWHEIRDPACKTALNWVTKTTRKMIRRDAIARRETEISNCEVRPHAMWPLAKSLMKRDRPKTPTAIHGPSGLRFLPFEKGNVTANCLENQFTPRDLCEENHER
jgi:hypothetical protein